MLLHQDINADQFASPAAERVYSGALLAFPVVWPAVASIVTRADLTDAQSIVIHAAAMVAYRQHRSAATGEHVIDAMSPRDIATIGGIDGANRMIDFATFGPTSTESPREIASRNAIEAAREIAAMANLRRLVTACIKTLDNAATVLQRTQRHPDASHVATLIARHLSSLPTQEHPAPTRSNPCTSPSNAKHSKRHSTYSTRSHSLAAPRSS